jgi:uncharacterized membrane protein YgcG
MRLKIFSLVFLAASLAGAGQVLAQTASPREIQGLIAAGQPQTALDDLAPVLQAHPNSGMAWYLDAEAQDALNNESAARTALAKAEQYAPGLPFAKPADVAALQAHLAQSSSTGGFSMSPVMIVLGLVVLFVLFRLFRRRRVAYYPPGYGAGAPRGYAPPGYAPPGYPSYGPEGGGLGSSLLGGLAAGAGFAAGERIIDDMTGRDQGTVDSAWGADPTPDRDDGLSGSPGWDSGSSTDDSSGGSDSGGGW